MSTGLCVSIRRSVGPAYGSLAYRKRLKATVERFGQTCAFCKFEAGPSIEIFQVKQDQWRPVCPFCLGLIDLDWAASQQMGDLIFLPEMTQSELNALVHTLWICSGVDTDQSKFAASRIWSHKLSERIPWVGGLYGEGLSEPRTMAAVLHRLPPEEYKQRRKVLGAIKMLPRPSAFRSQAEEWRRRVYARYPESMWQRLALQHLGQGSVAQASG